MVGSTGERVLAATLPHVDAWNTWFDWYGNTPEGFAAKQTDIDAASERAGRDPATLQRSACVLVQLDPEAGERPIEAGVTPLGGSATEIANGLREMAAAGADEVILVCDPITEGSVRELGAVLTNVRT
jgi:alkanesulfonate monooxygenase SsuD/methylene tetrahydromethanopterin reductase-like flavin-dependent oxidoreductase (luciferase family)